jgi:hypothetical protein
MREMVKEMDKCKIDICALQEIRWPGKGKVINKNYMILYSGNKSDKHEFGTGLTTGKKGKKTELTGKGPLRRRRSALDCSATEGPHWTVVPPKVRIGL